MSRTRRYSILVAEDEPLIRRNLVKKVREVGEGFEVVGEAHNGQAALEAVAELHPDVLITDVRMPVMDGLALIRELYYAHPDIRVIVVSGYDDFEYARTALQHGVQDYLLKPVNNDELRSALARILIRLDAEQEALEQEYPALAGPAAQEDLLRLVQEYLRGHFTEDLSVADLARRFHVSPPYLTRLFKRYAGVAPVRAIRDLRMAYACKVLEEQPELEIKEVSARVGYADQGYFSRVFRGAVGVSPLEYRERRAPQQRRHPGGH